MAVRITGLEIIGLGVFDQFKLAFPEKKDEQQAEIHIFTGVNGTGKTTLLEALMAPFGTNRVLGARRRLDVQKKQPASIIVSFSDKRESDSLIIGIDKQGSQATGYNNSSFISRYILPLKEGGEEPLEFCAFAYRHTNALRHVNITMIREPDDNPLAEAASFTKTSFSETLMNWVLNSKTKASLAESEGDQALASSYRKAIVDIEKIVSEITGWKVEFAINIRRLGVYLSVDGTIMPFDALPDGLKSMLSWLADMLMRINRLDWVEDKNPFERNLIVALDEIDIHLHPAWQRRILPVLQKYFPNSQFFVSTHSPFVVGSVDGAWVYRLKKEGQSPILLNGEPLLSEDAKSYSMLLEEVFGIKEEFGVAIEEQLKEFSELKNAVLNGSKSIDDPTLLQLVGELTGQSAELDSIIGMEMRQLNRLKTSATA